MDLVTQFKGRVKDYKIEENEQGYLLSFILNRDVVTFQCIDIEQVIRMIRSVGIQTKYILTTSRPTLSR